jgi:hypothetical protein
MLTRKSVGRLGSAAAAVRLARSAVMNLPELFLNAFKWDPILDGV